MNAPDLSHTKFRSSLAGRSSRKRVLLAVCLATLLVARPAYAARGDLVAEYGFAASAFVASPDKRYMYATIPSQNSIAIIDLQTLVAKTFFVGSGPTNIALSADGLKAYIANSSSSFVVVFNTQTRKVTKSLYISEPPQDVVVGSQNRLFVLGTDSIFQIDATTGASAGPNIGQPWTVYSGALEISPDRNSLYYGNYGLSPSSMYKYDVSDPAAPKLIWESPHGPHGSNGQDLTLSHNGSFISYACGYGQGGYKIAKFRTSDMAILGTFDTDAYPREIAFSPDDRVAYTVHTAGQIDVFDTKTFARQRDILAAGEATELSVDPTGGYLFAGYTDPFNEGFTGTRVFDTGRRLPNPPAQPLNISTRMAVGTGENVLIGGFIVTGTAPKKMIIRALGPSLTTDGVPVAGRLEDTVLEVRGNNQSLIASNDDWRATQEQAIIDSNVPPPDDRESAIVVTLQPGSYTAIVSGKDQTSGIGLVEVYDLDSAATSELANISTRGFVKTGDDVMIGGFILSAGAERNVIIRAIGPSLPVNDKLVDPVLELRAENGDLLASNDNWRSGGQEQEIIDTTVPPSNDAESALVRRLAPGAYTAIVRGVSQTTGVALVEVFALD